MEEKKNVYIKDNDFGNIYRLKLSEEAIKLLDWLSSNEFLCERIEVSEAPLGITNVIL